MTSSWPRTYSALASLLASRSPLVLAFAFHRHCEAPGLFGDVGGRSGGGKFTRGELARYLREVVRAARSALTESDGRVAFEGRTKIRGRRSAGALITTDANELIAEIHDRMPLILAPGDYIRWLSDEPDPHDLMRPFPAEPMRIWPISTRVNKPENDEPSIREPLELASSAA